MKAMRLRHVATVTPSNVDKVVDADEMPVRLCNYVDVYKYSVIHGGLALSTGSATKSEIENFWLRAGDVLITKDSEDPSDIAVPAYVEADLDDVVCGYHLAMLRPDPRRITGKYLFWALLAKPVRDAFSNEALGITRFGLSIGDIKSVPIPLPDLATQKAIAAFLDAETARIDALIEKKQKFAALLQEKQIAEIEYWVLGIHSNEQISKTGNKIIPALPKGWAVERLRFALEKIEQGWSPTAEERSIEPGEWGVLKVGCVNGGVFRPNEHKALPAGVEPRRKLEVHPGDLLMSRGNTLELVGSAAVAASGCGHLMLSDLLYRLTVRGEVATAEYLALCLNSRIVRRQIELVASGSSDSMPKISQTKIRQLLWPRAPLAYQERATREVGKFTNYTRSLTTSLFNSIDRLREFRAALITAAVTGRIDPADWRRCGEGARRLDAIERNVA